MIWALYQSSDGCFQQYNMPTHTESERNMVSNNRWLWCFIWISFGKEPQNEANIDILATIAENSVDKLHQ